uniref:Uncharacterized protein n=1 Tax=Monodon monoceros TaxID=40151 RepID=A0A8C6BY36_MONMO
MCVCGRVHVCVCGCVTQSSCFCQVFPWGRGCITLPLLPPPVPSWGAAMYIRGWAGQGAVPLWGSPGLWGGPGPTPGAVNVFRVGGREMEPPVCLREGWEGPPAWPWDSVVFYTCPPWQGWERWFLCTLDQSGGACCGWNRLLPGVLPLREGWHLLT